MSNANMCHASVRDSGARNYLKPLDAMLVKLEELDDYTHIALRQYPKAQSRYEKDRSALDEYRQQVCCLLAYTKHCHAHKTVEAILSETAPGRQKCK